MGYTCNVNKHSKLEIIKLKKYVEIKCQLDTTEVFIAELTACSTCFRHHYVYHQELKNTHTRPPRHSTHLITNLDNTRHFIMRTQILPNLQIPFYIFTAPNATGSNHCIIILNSWWWTQWCPKHVEQAISSAIKTSVASSWHFISTY